MKLRSKNRYDKLILGSVVALQLLFSLFFIFDLGADVFGFRKVPLSWEFHEAVQLITIVALLLGSLLGFIAFRNLARQQRDMERQMLVARKAFHELMWRNFDDWGLTPSECDVGIFVMKGLSNAEIAELRGKSIGTVKAQVNAIFRKADVNGRTQLISQFMDDLF